MNVDEAIVEVSRDLGIVFKDKQYNAIKSFCSGNDLFISLPTGYGKSLIYAALPLVFDKMKSKSFINMNLLVNCLPNREGWKHCCVYQPLVSHHG